VGIDPLPPAAHALKRDPQAADGRGRAEAEEIAGQAGDGRRPVGDAGQRPGGLDEYPLLAAGAGAVKDRPPAADRRVPKVGKIAAALGDPRVQIGHADQRSVIAVHPALPAPAEADEDHRAPIDRRNAEPGKVAGAVGNGRRRVRRQAEGDGLRRADAGQHGRRQPSKRQNGPPHHQCVTARRAGNRPSAGLRSAGGPRANDHFRRTEYRKAKGIRTEGGGKNAGFTTGPARSRRGGTQPANGQPGHSGPCFQRF